MPARHPALLLAGAGLTTVVLAAVLAGCDTGRSPAGGSDVPGATSGSAPATTTAPTTGTGSTPASTTSAPPATPTATPSVSGPATPSAAPGTFAIAVAGGGLVTYPVIGVRCDRATVVGTATPAGGGAAGTVTLAVGTGAVTVAGLAPLDGTRLTGTVSGTPGPGATVRWTGDGTGSAASLAVTCG